MIKTFPKGGIHPPDNKLSASAEIIQMDLPETATIVVSQHLGAPAKLLVNKGDSVKVGTKLAESGGFISANTHSPYSGTILKIDKVIDSSGFKKDAIVISVDGDDWENGIDVSSDLIKEIVCSQEEIQSKVFEAGIVGLGGAAFPSHVKLKVPDGKTAEVLLINAVECEPYLTADHRLMVEKPEEILVGIQAVLKALDINKAIIGIENNKKDAIQILTKLCESISEISVQPLKVQYPQGGEKQLIKACVNKEVPAGGLPIDIGVIVQNVGTIFAIYEAVQKNKPLVERIVTVTGKFLQNPSNFKVRIGTKVIDLIEKAGGLPENTEKVISGGPMMGKALPNLDVPITKGTSGILIVPNLEAKRATMNNCIRCGKCVSVCCVGVEPYLLMTYASKGMTDELAEHNIFDCLECGSCSYSCPANRPLLDYIRLGKATIKKQQTKK